MDHSQCLTSKSDSNQIMNYGRILEYCMIIYLSGWTACEGHLGIMPVAHQTNSHHVYGLYS